MVNLITIEHQLMRDFDKYNFILLQKIECVEIIIHISRLTLDYMFDNILEMAYQNIPLDFYNNIFEIYRIQLEDIWHAYDTDNRGQEYVMECLNNDIYNCIIISMNIIQKYYIPTRSYSTSFIRLSQTSKHKEHLRLKIEHLKAVPQPEQRTEEWYRFRHNTLTASNLWKVFYSESSQNQLIYEKCKPVEIHSNKPTNIETPFHWGQKYEPLSVLYYEFFYKTRVDDFGCIPHPEFPYMAASPDGINCDIDNERYGRMLEIKNIVNRDITGIPKMEYWVQMQIQMETCNLNECDFLETRFIEYSDYDEFINDPDFTENNTSGVNAFSKATYRGCIVHFEGQNGPIYEYHPFGYTIEEISNWEKQIMDKYPECSWVQTIYWKLAEISCILVLRNKPWFNKAQPYIEILWNIIQQEKNGDYSHRAPKKRIKRENNNTNSDNLNLNNNEPKCLLPNIIL